MHAIIKIMNLYGWKYTKSGRKYKYIYLRGDKKWRNDVLRRLKDSIKPYPKIDTVKDKLSDMAIIDSVKQINYSFANSNH